MHKRRNETMTEKGRDTTKPEPWNASMQVRQGGRSVEDRGGGMAGLEGRRGGGRAGWTTGTILHKARAS
jgi:hypothetical protein